MSAGSTQPTYGRVPDPVNDFDIANKRYVDGGTQIGVPWTSKTLIYTTSVGTPKTDRQEDILGGVSSTEAIAINDVVNPVRLVDLLSIKVVFQYIASEANLLATPQSTFITGYSDGQVTTNRGRFGTFENDGGPIQRIEFDINRVNAGQTYSWRIEPLYPAPPQQPFYGITYQIFCQIRTTDTKEKSPDDKALDKALVSKEPTKEPDIVKKIEDAIDRAETKKNLVQTLKKKLSTSRRR